MSEKSNRLRQIELPSQGTIVPKAYYRAGLLFSAQKDAIDPSRISTAMVSKDPVVIMKEPGGGIIIFDGCKRTALAIFNDDPLSFRQIDYTSTIRRWPFRIFYREFVKQLGLGAMTEY